jgi:hypothetical protein
VNVVDRIKTVFADIFVSMAWGFVSRADDEIDQRRITAKVNDRVKNSQIQRGWHLFAMEKTEGGPIATRITIVDELLFELGKIEAPKPFESEDTAFGTTTKFYEDSVKFSLLIEVLKNFDSISTKLKIKVRFQSCNSEMCLAPRTVLVESNFEKEEPIK